MEGQQKKAETTQFSTKPEKQELNFLFNVPMKVSVELGQGRINIRDLLTLGQGSVLELDKLAGEPLEVLVNNRLVSRGEVVVINDKYGVRLTDVINPEDKVSE